MNKLLKKFGTLVPYLRRYIALDREEKELRPKVDAGIKRVMANGNVAKKKKVTGKIRECMTENNVEVPA